MFPVDSLPVQYCEERAAAETAQRLAQQAQQVALPQVKAPVATRQAAPSSLAQALHPPPLSRTGSSSVFGHIFQGFVKRASSSTPSPAPSATPSRVQTPASESRSDKEKREMERLIAEMRKDTDIICLPSWH